MAKLIDKDALVAEIERLYDEKGAFYAADVLYNLEEWLDTLEVKEVDSTDAFIEKACEWLKSNLCDYAGEDDKRNIVPFDDAIFEDFKKAMEE